MTANTHPDYVVLSFVRDVLYQKANSLILMDSLQEIIIDSQQKLCALSKRTTFDLLSKEGKNYFAVCLEERLREDVFGLPKGNIHDMHIKDCFTPDQVETFLRSCNEAKIVNPFDIDFKNSVNGINNTMPPEILNDICFMIADSRHADNVSIGLFVARDDYLKPCANSGPGRDKKRALNANGKNSILWLNGPRSKPNK